MTNDLPLKPTTVRLAAMDWKTLDASSKGAQHWYHTKNGLFIAEIEKNPKLYKGYKAFIMMDVEHDQYVGCYDSLEEAAISVGQRL